MTSITQTSKNDDNNTTLVLLSHSLQWYRQVMKNILIRYKILFIFIVTLISPTLPLLFNFIITPSNILLAPKNIDLYLFISCLLGMQLFGLILLLVHRIVLSGRPWDKYLLSLNITIFQNLIVDISMLLIFDALIWLPLLCAYISFLTHNDNESLEIVALLLRCILFLELSIFSQILLFKRKYPNLLSILCIDVVIITSVFVGNNLFQIILFIFLMSLIFLLMIRCYLPQQRSEKLSFQKRYIFNLNYSSYTLYQLTFKNLAGYLSPICTTVFLPLILFLLIGYIQIYESCIPNLPLIITIIMLVNALCISNLFKYMQTNWQDYSPYIKSLPISKWKLFYARLLVVTTLLLICNTGTIVICFAHTSNTDIKKMFFSLSVSLVYLFTTYYPQVTLRRYGLLMSLLLMFIFLYINCTLT